MPNVYSSSVGASTQRTRMFAEGHAVALHSDSRLDLLTSPAAFARKLTTNADRIERLAGHRPIRAFHPHAGWRSAAMYARRLQTVVRRRAGRFGRSANVHCDFKSRILARVGD